MEDPPHTEDLVARARAGEDAAYEELFAHVAERLLVYIRVRLGRELASRLEPLDVLQDVYAEAHRSFAAFEPEGAGSFSAWLFGVAEHRLHKLARHFGAQKRRPPGGLAAGSQLLERLRASATGPSTAFARQEQSLRLQAALEQLEPDQREMVLLRHFRELSVEEIAAQLGCSARTVRRQLVRARAALGQAFGA